MMELYQFGVWNQKKFIDSWDIKDKLVMFNFLLMDNLLHHVLKMKLFEFGIIQCKFKNNYSEGSSVAIKAHAAPVRSVQFSCDG